MSDETVRRLVNQSARVADPPNDADADYDAEAWMQPRCIWCKREQYALNVLPVSLGINGCAWCGRTAPIFRTREEYIEALRAPLAGDVA